MKRGFVGAILAGICVVLGVAVAYVSSKQDRTDPVITVSEGALTYTEGEGTEGLLTGVTASDKEDGDLTKNIFVEKVVPISENKAIVYYGVLDKSQNVGTATKEVEYFPAGQQPPQETAPAAEAAAQPLAPNGERPVIPVSYTHLGFTENEVKNLCMEYGMDFEEAKAWYDGYGLITHKQDRDICYSMYSPKSVVEAMLRHKFGTYWNQTETYEALKVYIQMNMDGLKDAIVGMLAGESIRINTGTFSNDMTTFATRDDILTLLVHLGYLTYDGILESVSIPNKEVSKEYVNAISTMDWKEVITSVEESRRLLESLWNMDGEAVAEGIDRAHREISILQYNDENSLSCTINLAFYFAREYYTIIRECPSGKGFADICFIPRKLHADKPAVVIELKWNKSAKGAIDQIKEKQYIDALKDYEGNLLLAGINYDRETKKHTCMIEKMNIS